MDRGKVLQNKLTLQTFEELQALHESLSAAFTSQFDRSLPFSDEIFDRWARAKSLGWGEGSSVYDSSYIFGKVVVGNSCWIGPFTIIDGSGGLTIGNHCTISSGVHIYSHDNVKQTLSSGKLPIEHAPVQIGNNTYIGPQTIISKGVTIGSYCVVASNSFVKDSIPDFSIVAGNPAKIIGTVVVKENKIEFLYPQK